ncbi:LamG domain-containing protein [Moritella sp. F3]|uniref:LamG domain-containing protein n=1 Tax=Moritella sp. F3 TaxID=2718882 RepID=UPI0018E10378|nr:LamG domain-containing protein [Moritella sp. F3]GIC78442.1 hypothetical protein FMO001_31690 [Moritella sp. F1]GIC83942.1 hypothetical protein FMO003_42220 [Moritella sp. F3]
MPFKIIVFVFSVILFSSSIHAAKTYDFATRSPGIDAFAYDGINFTKKPSDNTSPTRAYSGLEYTRVSTNDNTNNIIWTNQNNAYPMVRYVFELDEAEADIQRLDFFWNGKGINDKHNQDDGVVLYLWNYSSNGYVEIDNSGNTTAEVDLTHTITANIANYIDENNNNKITLLVVSNDNVKGWRDNKIRTDYVSVEVKGKAVDLEPILDYRFDECSYTGNNGDVIDQIGDFNGMSNGMSKPINEAVINTSLDLSENGTSDWVHVPSGAVDGLNDFSVSVWFKTAENKTQQEIFHALGGDDRDDEDDELEIFLREGDDRGGKDIVYIKIKDDKKEIESNIELTNNTWHHLVVTREGHGVCLFIDGAPQQCVSVDDADALSVRHPNAVVIGQEQDDFGGDFSTSQNFEGQLDEFKIFDGKLSSTQITSIYQNESLGRNFDGSTRLPAVCSAAEPVLEYRFDEVSWDGTPNEVDNNLSHNHDGQAFGKATTTNNTEGQICRAGNFSGLGEPGYPGDYINVSGINEYLKDSASLSFWIKTSQPGNNTAWQAPGILGVEQIGTGNDIFWGYLDGAGRIGIKKGNGAAAVSSGNVNDNEWHHVVLTRNIDDNVVEVFVDGVRGPNGRAQSESGVVSTTFSSIGRIENRDQNNNDNNGISKYFIGQLDELLIYNSVLSQSDVSFIYDNQNNKRNYDGSTDRFCPSEPSKIDHFEIEHDSYGLTCEAEIITVNACLDASCSTLSNKPVTLDVKALGSSSVVHEISFTGTGAASIPYTTAGSVILSVEDASITAENPTVCVGGSSRTPCLMTFADSGFRFTSSISSNGIPTQLSGKPSNVGYNRSTLALQAIKKNTVTGVCEAALIGTTLIELSAECIEPATCKSNVKINSTTITNPNTPVSLDFGDEDNNAATFNLTYPDAGKVQLHARYNIPVDGDPSGDYMKGSSNSLVVRPFGFSIEAADNPKAESAADAKYKKAGEKFTTSVTAVQWQAGQDNDNDGIPDSGRDLSNNKATPNFGQENTAETVILTHQLVAPSGGSLGSLSGNTIMSFTLGEGKTTNLSWSEVGIIDLTANLSSSSYLGVGPITGTTPYVGRFIPDNFQQIVIEHGTLFATCGANSPFAYSGQMDETDDTIGAITYLTKPVLNITAHNTQGELTKNYTGDFAKLMFLKTDDKNKISFNAPVTTHSNGLALTGKFPELGDIVDLGNGLLTYTLSQNDNFVYIRDADSEIAPFDASFDLPFDVFKDSDGITFKASGDNGDYFETPKFNSASDNTVEIRFGRLVLQNSFGPEMVNLTQQLQVEYFDGNNFIVSADDNCLSYDDAKLSSSPDIDTLGGTGPFIDGETRSIQLDAQDPDSAGTINVLYDTHSWLEFDWDNVTGYDDPFAIATFGLYRGNDRVIYRRKVVD